MTHTVTLATGSSQPDRSNTPTPISAPRRRFLQLAALSAGGISAVLASPASQAVTALVNGNTQQLHFTPIVPAPAVGKSPWGEETYKETASQPQSIRPGEAAGIPDKPRPYTEILSYHAHIYFDEDNYPKAAKLRQWVIERFPVELGNWNLEPRGPHVTPSFYFGFTNDLLPIIIPWLQLNSLGLTILLHPNTDNPKADHLYYTLWVNRSQPVNAYRLPESVSAIGELPEQIFPNLKPHIPLET